MTPTAFALAAAAALALAARGEQAPPDPRDRGPDRIDVSRYPTQQQKEYPVFATKCAKCHPLARTINTRFSSTDWKRYLKRMIRRPNSGINEEQAQLIYDFLKYYASVQERDS